MHLNKPCLALAFVAASFFSCSKPAQSNGSETDDAKLRPEVAAAQGGATPSPVAQPSATTTP